MDGDEDGDNDDVEENDDNNDDENDDNDEDGGNGDENDADWLTALTDEQIWIQSSITGLPNLVLGKIWIEDNFNPFVDDDNCNFIGPLLKGILIDLTQQLWAFPKYWTLQCKINFNW